MTKLGHSTSTVDARSQVSEPAARTRRVVINSKHGGFGLSPEATLWLYAKGCKGLDVTHVDEYWPPEKRAEDESKWKLLGYAHAISEWRLYLAGKREGRTLFLNVFSPDEKYVLNAREVSRHDPLLLQVIEEMGDKANGQCAALKVVEIPADVDYVIEEYDGSEWVAEKHRTWA